VLAGGNYALTLSSRADGFVDTHGRLLDGDGDGVAGGNFVVARTMASSTAAILSLGEFARGPGQSVDLPLQGTGIPVLISQAAGVGKIAFTLRYDASLLNISGVNSPIAGAIVDADLTTPGHIRVTVTGISGLGNGSTEVLRLVATVPAGAIADRYGAKHVLDLSDVLLDDGTVAVRDDDGLHVVAYLGDTSGNADYNSLDTQYLQRLTLRIDSGFGAYPLADPLIIGDANGNGALTAVDLRMLNFVLLGQPQPGIPALPGLPAITYSGADPLVSLPSVTAAPGEVVTVPVQLDTAKDLNSVQLTIVYPSQDVELVAVRKGELTVDFGSMFVNQQPGQVTVDMSRFNPMLDGKGNLLELDFRVAPTASGVVPIDLQWARLNETRLTLNPAPQVGRDPTDGEIRVESSPSIRFDRSPQTLAVDRFDSTRKSWLGDWVSRDANRSGVSRDWRVVLPNGGSGK
jgi:hypothetical protein